MEPKLTKDKREEFEKQQYRIVGRHSVVKVCSWTKQCLRGKGNCYKNTFYGIKTWRCVEMSPTWLCDHRCLFCWRDTAYAWPKWQGPVDEPKEIVDGCIKEWRDLLYGFGGSETVDREKYAEVDKPLHFAISLTGEPTFYPKLPELIKEVHSRGMTTFLVTNGTVPGMIQRLLDKDAQPTQLYVSLVGCDIETYEKTARPLPKDAWDNLITTLKLMKKFNRSTIRLTMVKDLNMHEPEKYAELIKIAGPDFVEVKGYMHIGHARNRLKVTNMPEHKEIQEFAKKVAEATGYHYTHEREESRVILLQKNLSKNNIIEGLEE